MNHIATLCLHCFYNSETRTVWCYAPSKASPPSLPKCKNFANCGKPAFIDPLGKVHVLCRRACIHLNKPEQPVLCPKDSLPKCANFANCGKLAFIDPLGKVHKLCRRACLRLNKQEKPLQCPVFGCFDNHSQHFCKICKNNNSDHESADCPKTACDICSMERKSHSIIDGNLCCNGRNALFVKK